MRFCLMIRHCLIVESVLIAFPALAGASELHEVLPEADAWQIVLAGVLMLAAIGRKHFASDQ